MAALASPVVFLGCVPPPQTFSTHPLQCVVGRRGWGGAIPCLAVLYSQKMGSSPSPRTWEWPEWEVGSLQV